MCPQGLAPRRAQAWLCELSWMKPMQTTRDTAEVLWVRPTSLWKTGRPADAPLWRVSWTAQLEGALATELLWWWG